MFIPCNTYSLRIALELDLRIKNGTQSRQVTCTRRSSVSPTSLLSKREYNKTNKKATETSHKRVFWMKTSACMDGTLKNQPNYMGMTHNRYIFCRFSKYAHHKTLCLHLTYSYALNEQGTQHSSLHSLLHKKQSIATMFSSNKISEHNLNSNIPYRPSTCTPQFPGPPEAIYGWSGPARCRRWSCK